MSILINDTVVYLRETGGMVEALIRADTYADWAMGAYYYGLINSDGNASPGVNISEVGFVVITPGTYGVDGDELTPPVMDNRFHFNLRLTEPALSVLDDVSGLPRWQAMGINWTTYGALDTNPNKNEVGVSLQSVVLIDADTIATDTNIWI